MNWFKKEVYNEEDLKAKEIVELMLNSAATLIEINPKLVGLEYILSNEDNQYYVVIDDLGVKITNHVFFRDMRMSSGKTEELKELARKEASLRRENKKTIIYQNGVGLLNKIITNLNKE